jgi:hypothetical protein
MKRPLLAVFGGLIAWIVIVSLLNRALRLALAGYAAAEPAMQFTLAMMAARLTIAALTSLIAGAVVSAVAPASRGAPWILGVLLLILFVPSHVWLWHRFPLWYHLTFLLTLAPLVAAGGWMWRSLRAPLPQAGPSHA